MAKLSAHRRTELARVTRRTPGAGNDIESISRTYALVSDGTVLVKVVYQWVGPYPATDRGWKKVGRVGAATWTGKPDVEAWVGYYTGAGYERVTT